MNHKFFLSPTQTLDLSIYQSWIITVKMEVTSKHGFFQSWDAAIVQANNNDSSERPFGLWDVAISCQICGLTTILGSARMRHKLPRVIRFLLGKMFREWLAARQEPLLNGQWIRRGRGGGGATAPRFHSKPEYRCGDCCAVIGEHHTDTRCFSEREQISRRHLGGLAV